MISYRAQHACACVFDASEYTYDVHNFIIVSIRVCSLQPTITLCKPKCIPYGRVRAVSARCKRELLLHAPCCVCFCGATGLRTVALQPEGHAGTWWMELPDGGQLPDGAHPEGHAGQLQERLGVADRMGWGCAH